MAKYASKLTKEDLTKAGIKNIIFNSLDMKYHIIGDNDNEIKLYRNQRNYLYFNIYALEENGQHIKVPIKKKSKYTGFMADTYIYKMKAITLHRAVYAWYKGEVPEGFIVDHIDNKHYSHYDSRISNLQLLTPAENLAKERPGTEREKACLMTKTLNYYREKYDYWKSEYFIEKTLHSSSTKRAHHCRTMYSQFKAKMRYWENHKEEYYENEMRRKARNMAISYQQERQNRLNWFKREIQRAKMISNDRWHQKIKECEDYKKIKPFKALKELETTFFTELKNNGMRN